MDTTTDTTTTDTSDSQMDAEMRALAVSFDRGEALPTTDTTGSQGAEVDSQAQSQSEGKIDKPTQTGAALPSGKKPDAAATTGTGQDQQQQPPQESEYAKYKKEQEQFRKDQERQNRAWQSMQAEKQQLAAERAELQRLRNQQPVTLNESQQNTGPLARYSDADLIRSAERYEAEGNQDFANLARQELQRRKESLAQGQRGQELPQQDQSAQQAQRQAQEAQRRERFVATWTGHLETEKAANPDLANPKSDLYKEVAEVIKDYPYFSSKPDGIREAVIAAKLRLDAKAAPALRKQLEEQKKELEGYRLNTNPGGGSMEERGAPGKSLDAMSMDDAEKALRAMAAEADGFSS